MGARRATRYTDGDKQTQARPRLHARRRGAERVSRAQDNIVTIGWTTGGGSVRDEGWVNRAAPRDPCRYDSCPGVLNGPVAGGASSPGVHGQKGCSRRTSQSAWKATPLKALKSVAMDGQMARW